MEWTTSNWTRRMLYNPAYESSVSEVGMPMPAAMTTPLLTADLPGCGGVIRLRMRAA